MRRDRRPCQVAALPQVMQLLTQHLRCNKRDALVGYMEALAVFFGINTDLQTRRDARSAIDDDTVQNSAAPDLDVRQNDSPVDRAVAVYSNTGKEQRALHGRSTDNAAARNHRVDGCAAPSVFVEDELRRRQLFLIGPYGPRFIV